jgi:hypothetical protein
VELVLEPRHLPHERVMRESAAKPALQSGAALTAPATRFGSVGSSAGEGPAGGSEGSERSLARHGDPPSAQP